MLRPQTWNVPELGVRLCDKPCVDNYVRDLKGQAITWRMSPLMSSLSSFPSTRAHTTGLDAILVSAAPKRYRAPRPTGLKTVSMGDLEAFTASAVPVMPPASSVAGHEARGILVWNLLETYLCLDVYDVGLARSIRANHCGLDREERMQHHQMYVLGRKNCSIL